MGVESRGDRHCPASLFSVLTIAASVTPVVQCAMVLLVPKSVNLRKHIKIPHRVVSLESSLTIVLGSTVVGSELLTNYRRVWWIAHTRR